MKKSLFGMIFTLCLCLGLTTQAGAASWTSEDGTYTLTYVVKEDDTIKISSASGTVNGALILPSEIEGKKVTEIGKSAFYKWTGITSVTFPDEITTIGEMAFDGCTGLTGDLTIPDTVTQLGRQAFNGCTGLNGTLALSKNLKTIEPFTFQKCGFTGALVIPDGVTLIENFAFSGCAGFTGDLTIPGSVEKINGSAFSGCTGLNGTLTLMEGVTGLGGSAFAKCSFTGDIILPNSLTTMGKYVFNGCGGGNLVLGTGMTSIPEEAFRGSEFSGTLTIPEGVVEIGKYAFAEMPGLTGDLTIPDSMKHIYSYAFYKDTGLTGNLVLGSGLETVNLSDLKCTGNLTIKKMNEGVKKFTYSASSFTGDLTILAGEIPSSAFNQKSNFKGTLTLGEGVTSIGESAFDRCTGFTGTLEIPGTVTDIASGAFLGCTGFTGLSLSEGLTSIGESAFNRCTGMAGDLMIPDTVTTIGQNAFYGCSSFDGAFHLSQKLTGLGKNAFYEVSGLTGTVTIPGTLKTVPENAFYKMAGLTGLKVEEGVESIEKKAFYQCSGMKGGLELPDSLVSLGEQVFYECKGFNGKLTIGDGLMIVPKQVFYGCSGFTGLKLGDSVVQIKDAAFSSCTGMKGELTLPETLEVVGSAAFYNCGFTGDLIIPDSVQKIYGSAFYCEGLNGDLVLGRNLQLIGTSSVFYPNSFTGSLTIKNGKENDAYLLRGQYGFTGDLTIQAGEIPEFFKDNTNYKGRLILGEYVTDIPSNAFSGCTGFTEVTLPKYVRTIGDNAFLNCSGLTGEIKFPECLRTIGKAAFSGCSGLTGDLVIPDSVYMLGEQAFYNCSGLDGTLTIGEGIREIGASTFHNCSNLTGELELPVNMTSIGDYAFCNCSKLTGELRFPDALTMIGDCAFYNAAGFTGGLRIPESVTEIGDDAFAQCTGLTGELILPMNLQSLGSSAFKQSGISGHLVIPHSLGAPYDYFGGLSESVFAGCKNLTSVFIPYTSLNMDTSIFYATIGDNAFSDTGITDVYTDGRKDNVAVTKLEYTGIDPDDVTWHYGGAGDAESLYITGSDSVNLNETINLNAVVYPRGHSTRGVKWSSDDESIATVDSTGVVTGVSNGVAVITATYGDLSATRIVTVGQGGHRIEVYATPDGNPLNRAPLEGAKVTIYGVSKTTDANGIVTFAEEEIPNYYSPINISCDDYFEINDNVYFMKGFVNSFTMTGKGDEIYITQADMRNGTEDWNLLSGRGAYCIPKMDGSEVNSTAYPVTIGVDWNKYEEGEIYFFGMDNGRRVYLHRGTNFISFAEHFDVNEQIKLVAQTKDDAGKIIRHEVDVPLGMYLDVEIVIPATEKISTGGENGLYFLEKFDLEMDLGEISECASKAKLEKGVLTLEFDAGEMDEKLFSICDGALEGKKGMKVDLGGKLSIDLTGKTGFWQGSVVVGLSGRVDDFEGDAILAQSGQKTVEILGMRRNVPAGNLNIVVGIELRAGVEAELTIGGTFEDVGVGGKMTGYGEFSVAAGPGIDIDGADAFSNEDNYTAAVQLKGKLEGKFPVVYEFSVMDATKQSVGFEPELTGYISGVALIQLGTAFDLEAELKLGGVRWTKAGVEWYTLGNGWSEPQTIMMRSALGQHVPAAAHSGIHTAASSTVALVDGVPNLFFTSMDDGGVLNLYRAVWNGLGWGEPMQVSADDTADFSPSADGEFVAWEDHSGVVADTDDLAGMLSMTEISVGVLGEDGYEVTRLTDDTAYDHTVKVKSADGKALVAWLRNDLAGFDGNLNSLYNNPAICYTVYDGSAWSEVVTVSDIGYVTNLNVTLDGASGAICYKDHTGEFFTIPVDLDAGGQAPSVQQKDVGRYAVTTLNGEQLLVWFDSEQNLHIQQGSEEAAVLETNFTAVENPVITAVGETAWIFWLEHAGIFYATNASGAWSGRMCLVQDGEMLRGLSCQGVDEEHYVLSYLRTYLNGEGEQISDLMTLYAEHGTDLWVLDVDAEDGVYTDRGTVDYTVLVYNHGEKPVTDVTVSFYEGETCVYTEEMTVTIPSGSFGELEGRFSPTDGSSIHDYTVVVEANDDFRSSNDGGELSVGSINGSIVDAAFTADAAGKDVLSVLVSSNGSAPLTGAELVVHSGDADGEVLARTELSDMAGGQSVQILLDVEPVPGELYYVALEMETADANPYDNWELLAVEETISLSELPACSSEISGDGVLNITLNPLDADMESGIVSVAVYDASGKMTQVIWQTMAEIDYESGFLTAQVDLSGVASGSVVKIMILNEETLTPACEAQELKI